MMHCTWDMGHIARQYQIHTRHMDKYWPHLSISEHCYHCHHQVSTYQHECFKCGIMPQIWNTINNVLNDAGLAHTLTSIAALTEFLYDAHNPTFTLARIANTNVIMVTFGRLINCNQLLAVIELFKGGLRCASSIK